MGKGRLLRMVSLDASILPVGSKHTGISPWRGWRSDFYDLPFDVLAALAE